MKPKAINQISFVILILIISGCASDYEKGINCLNEKKYMDAEYYFNRVPELNKNYKNAQYKLTQIDSIRKQLIIKKAKSDQIAAIEQEKQDAIELKKQLKEDIKYLAEFDNDIYRGDVTKLQAEIAVFKAFSQMVFSAQMSKDPETKNLGNTLKIKLVALQRAEFPKIRKNYGELLNTKLWEQDIKVMPKGSSYSTLEFIGGIFAANKNKQDMQNTLNQMLRFLRFKKVNYKWYEYDDEYTYYSLETANDGELVE